MSKSNIPKLSMGAFLSTMFLFSLVLATSQAYADTSDEVDVTINVPAVCSFATEDHVYNKQIIPGNYDVVGVSKMKAYCNDNNGFAIYAVGFGNDTYGDNTLSATVDNNEYTIETGTATSGNVSAWHMKLDNDAEIENNNTATIENGFNNNHEVPTVYTKVVSRGSGTDRTIDTNLVATYSAFIAGNQYPTVYQGKVKYTLVHPAGGDAPIGRPATLDTGQNVNAKMKSLASGSNASYETPDNLIKVIRSAASLPDGFVATDANTISLSSSEYPVYIFFDNTNNAGVMNVYAGNATVVMHQGSSNLFANFQSLADISALADWDTRTVVDMNHMFNGASSLTSVSALAGWNTKSAAYMNSMFEGASSLSDISGLSGWNTSSAVLMGSMFKGASSLTSVSALAGWNTISAYDMNHMFSGASSLTSLVGLASWNTESALYMNSMFEGDTSLTNISAIANWDVGKVELFTFMFNGVPSATTDGFKFTNRPGSILNEGTYLPDNA
jgi:hypothetical protein